MEKGSALPKNIRQIGEISGREKVCIEDYVMTWIHKREQEEDKGYLGLFFGEQQETEDSTYVYIRGVFEIPAEIQEPQQREEIQQEYEKHFGEWSVQGCCVIGVYPTERMKTLGTWIPESGKLIYHLQDQEETLYWTGEEQYRRLRGYFVFYEQNKKMQEYLAEVFKDNSVEKESAPDRAIRSFREKVKEKGEQKQSSLLRMASSFFVITVLIIGAIVVNRVEDIRMARNLSATGGTAVYQPQVEKEDDQTDMTEDEGSTRDTAAMSAVQYNAVQKAAEEAALSGSDAFWEKSDPEDVEGQSQEESGAEAGTAEEQGNADSAVSASPADTDEAANSTADLTQSSVENLAADPEQSSADNSATDMVQPTVESSAPDSSQPSPENPPADPTSTGLGDSTDGDDAQEAVAVRHTQAGYVIREGDTLAKICNRYYGSIDRIAEICEINGIEDANVIMPGQRIVLP